jgi:lipopolysaccharide/colanic/teichoic acid biosynthesis glycosyltransferase
MTEKRSVSVLGMSWHACSGKENHQMRLESSPPDIRRTTKGGSMSNGRLDDGFSQTRSAAWSGRDNDPAPFLRRIVFDLFQRQLGAPSSITGKENLPGSNGERAPHAAKEISTSSVRRVPGWKSGLDIICILLSLPVWLPLMLLLMLVTRLASPGPVFYRQKRVGLGGRHFFIWKFRTMKLSADTRTHERYFQELMRADCPMTKLDAHGDPRLAPFGRFLRASGLDELPQIFNVLCGEMSLVGPRPCLPNEFAHYEPWQRERVNGLPGLTGYWQVNGKNKTTFNQMVAMDLFYFKNLSILLDLKIMLRTCTVIACQLFESRATTQAGRRNKDFHSPRSNLPSLGVSARKGS